MFEAVNVILLVGMLLSALLVIQVRRIIDAVIAFSAVGTFLTLIFFQMQAPDVALSEAAVGAVAVPMVVLISMAKIRSLVDNPSEAQ